MIARRRVIAGLGLGLLLGAAGCAGQVHQDCTPCSDFSELRTYAWVTDDPVLIQLGEGQPRVRTEANERRLRAAIDEALAARGLTRVARERADVRVGFSVGTRARYRLEGGPDSWMASLRPGEKHTQGTLHIYLLQPGDRNAVWHGSTTRWLEPGDDPDTVIREAVAHIMAEYPAAPR